MEEFEPYFENIYTAAPLVLGGFTLAFFITYLAIPSIVSVAQAKMLYDMPHGRSSHTKATPVLGGIAIFAGLVISTITFSVIDFDEEFKYILCGLVILFFIGVKNDILTLDSKNKLVSQLNIFSNFLLK